MTLIWVMFTSSNILFAEDAVEKRWNDQYYQAAVYYSKFLVYPPESSKCKTKNQTAGSPDSYIQCLPMISKTIQPRAKKIVSDCQKHMNHEKQLAQCNAKLTRLFQEADAKMKLRYKFTDWNEVDLKCKASEEDVCRSLDVIESYAMLSNDQRVITALDEDCKKIQQSHIAEMQFRTPPTRVPSASQSVLRAVGSILQGMGNGLKNSRGLQCTTNTLGSTAYTNCQ